MNIDKSQVCSHKTICTLSPDSTAECQPLFSLLVSNSVDALGNLFSQLNYYKNHQKNNEGHTFGSQYPIDEEHNISSATTKIMIKLFLVMKYYLWVTGVHNTTNIHRILKQAIMMDKGKIIPLIIVQIKQGK